MQIFLDSLDLRSQAKIIAYIDKLIELLNVSPFPNHKFSKFLKDGIFELKVNLTRIFRVFYLVTLYLFDNIRDR